MPSGTYSGLRDPLRRTGLGAAFLLAFADPVLADHFSGASITYDCLGGNQYRINLDLYLDCAGVPITPQTLYFSNNCGVVFSQNNLNPISVTEVSPLCPSQAANSRCNGGTQPGFKLYTFQSTLFLSPCNAWKVEWYICCRNTMVNIAVTPGMYAVASLNNLGGLCDNSPRFIDSGIPYVCVGQPVAYNPGVSDPDGNSLSFALISARFATPLPTPVTYQGGYTAAQPIAGITINPNTGQLAFTPASTGYYVVVFEVGSYTAGGVLIGKVMRDLMFAVIVCDGNPPTTQGLANGTGGLVYNPGQFIACNGQSFCVDMVFTDPQPGSVVSVLSNATSVLPGASFTVTGTNPATATICWTASEAQLPLNIWFEASDNACPIANSISVSATAIGCIFLPVELLDLQAELDRGVVQVRWTTASEAGLDRFIIERAMDGLTFLPIGEVNAAGTSHGTRQYRYTDDAPLPVKGYYRLQQVDTDGTINFSHTVSVSGSSPRMINATFNGNAWVIEGATDGSEWHVLDGTGRERERGTYRAGSGPLTIAMEDKGIRLLVIRGDMRTWIFKLPSLADPGSTIAAISRD